MAAKTLAETVQQNKQNYPGSVVSYDTRLGNEMGLLYNTSEPTRGKIWNYMNILHCKMLTKCACGTESV